jgi:hypothetical protein
MYAPCVKQGCRGWKMGKAVYCQNCGMMIVFERTARGKQMPVDTPGVWYKPDTYGRDTFLNDRGHIVKGWTLDDKTDGAQFGHKPHFISCKGYEKPKKAQKASRAQK